MLYAKPCCAVDPIENEEDRKKVEKKKKKPLLGQEKHLKELVKNRLTIPKSQTTKCFVPFCIGCDQH